MYTYIHNVDLTRVQQATSQRQTVYNGVIRGLDMGAVRHYNMI